MKSVLQGLLAVMLLVRMAGICQTTASFGIVKDFNEQSFNYDSLNNVYPSAHIDERFRSVFLRVRPYFPELANNTIDLKFKKHVSRTISARPRVAVFRARKSRQYVILIKTGSDGYVLENELNAQIGLIGHEFSHLSYYSTKSNMSLLAFGLRYLLSGKFRRETERNTDVEVIRRGLGWQLKSMHLYLKSSEIDAKMKEFGY